MLFFIQFTSLVITCPKIYPVADTLVTCSTGSRYGSNCDFECSSSATLNGTQSVVCERYNEESYGYWTWGEQQPFCQGMIIAIFFFFNFKKVMNAMRVSRWITWKKHDNHWTQKDNLQNKINLVEMWHYISRYFRFIAYHMMISHHEHDYMIEL